MGLFSRKGRGESDGIPVSPPTDPDQELPALSREDAVLLHRLVRDAFAHRGTETTSAGTGMLRAIDGQTYGLTNLSCVVVGHPRSQWPRLAAEHAEAMLSSHDETAPTSFEEARDLVYPRLRWAADLPSHPAYAFEVLPGVLELAALDYPSHVAELFGDDRVDQLGGWSALRAAGMANLMALPAMHHETLQADPERDDSVVHLLTSEDFFGPSRYLILDDVLAGLGVPMSPHGVLVAVPNRHLLAVHPVTGVGVIGAMQLLIRIAVGECDSQPGAISPHVYFRPRTGPAEQVTHVEDNGATGVRVDGAFAEAFAELGLIDG